MIHSATEKQKMKKRLFTEQSEQLEALLCTISPRDISRMLLQLVAEMYREEWQEKVRRLNADFHRALHIWGRRTTSTFTFGFICFIQPSEDVVTVYSNSVDFSKRMFNHRNPFLYHDSKNVISHAATNTPTGIKLSHNYWHCKLPDIY